MGEGNDNMKVELGKFECTA